MSEENLMTPLEEPLFKEDPSRFVLFPIKHSDIWEAYENHKNAFWTAQEIDYAADLEDWGKLNENEKYFIEHILAFFAGSDGIVLENHLLKRQPDLNLFITITVVYKSNFSFFRSICRQCL